MCGIAGVYLFGGRTAIPGGLLESMAACLTHRGPDSSGIYRCNSAGLAHRRLKIIDLSEAASQPMRDEQSRYSLIFNGEIYNYRELRKELTPSFEFFSQSDTEVILRLFQQYGTEAWPKLNGMFALALYDSGNNELHLARDHAGIKPLYYSLDDERLLFASELKALLKTLPSQPELDHESIAVYLRYGYLPDTRTPYKRIYKLLPAETLHATAEGVQRRKFWRREDFNCSRQHMQTDSAASEVERLLRKAVETHMISDVPIGAFLSGGIDSSLITALMTEISPAPVKTFTIGFTRGDLYDERPHARKIADALGTQHYEFAVDQGAEEMITSVSSVFDEPFSDSSAIPTFFLARLAREHVTVALSGTGGDEIFGGYRKYMAAHWTAGYQALPASLQRALQKSSSVLPASRASIWKERALLFQRFVSMTEAPFQLAVNQVFSTEEISRLTETNYPGESFSHTRTAGLPEQMMLFDYLFYLPEDLLQKEDRCTMAFGLEARVPFLDRELVEYVSRLPMSFKVTAANTKRLLKRVARKYVPAWVIKRPKHGFALPAAEWLRNDLQAFVSELLFGRDSYLNNEVLREKWTAHQKTQTDYSKQLWAAAMLELWIRNHRGSE